MERVKDKARQAMGLRGTTLKIKKATDLLYSTVNIAIIFNNCKWSIIFNIVNHYVVHLKYVILYIIYTEQQKQGRGMRQLISFFTM